MLTTLPRPYKEREPRDTTAAIQRILAELDLLPDEIESMSPYPRLHSLRLSLPSFQGSYGTNGKGRSVEYCLASAHAEFVERIQNGLFHRLCRTMIAGFRDRYGIRLGQFEKARKSIDEFLGARAEKYRYAYYDRVSQYLARRAEGLTHAEAADQLAQGPEWGEQGRQVAEELADPREVFRFVKLPNCPDCGECELQSECITTGILSTVERVYPAMRHSRIDQMALAWVSS